MNRRILLTVLVLFLAVGASAYPTVDDTTGTITVTSTNSGFGMNRLTLSWVSSASDVNGHIRGIYGTLLRAVVDPGSASPTASYDMVLYDDDVVDVLRGYCANLSATATVSYALTVANKESTPGIYHGVPVSGNLNLVISNAGISKTGKITLYWK